MGNVSIKVGEKEIFVVFHVLSLGSNRYKYQVKQAWDSKNNDCKLMAEVHIEKVRKAHLEQIEEEQPYEKHCGA
jgi:hypothetical protein